MKKNKLILFLVAITFFIYGFPLIIFGIEKTFFIGIDPDVVYITNALLYTKYNIISYADHPGTPTIMLLYYLFFPLRFYAKYIVHQGFIQWSFDNYSFLTYYSRVFELLLTSLALFIYLKAVSYISKSRRIVIFIWLAASLFIGLGFSVHVVPENLSFFLASVWLTIFIYFCKKKTYLSNALLVIISGFALANKFTTLFLLLTSLFLPVFIKKLKIDQKFVRVQFNILLGSLSFYIGIRQALGRFTYIKNWAISLFIHSGGHGTGNKVIFDWATYWGSVKTLVTGLPVFSIFLALSVVLFIYAIYKKHIKFNDPFTYLYTMAMLGITIFSKYSVIHYNLINISLVIFCTGYFLSKLKTPILKYTTMVLLVFFLINIKNNIINTNKFMKTEKEETVEEVVASWTPYWSADIFREQLDGKLLNP